MHKMHPTNNKGALRPPIAATACIKCNLQITKVRSAHQLPLLRA
jgi:hypothetical protein